MIIREYLFWNHLAYAVQQCVPLLSQRHECNHAPAKIPKVDPQQRKVGSPKWEISKCMINGSHLLVEGR